MAAQGAFGADFYDRSTLRPKNRAYYRSDRPVIKIGPKGALGSHEIRPIDSAPSLGQSILCTYINIIHVVCITRSLLIVSSQCQIVNFLALANIHPLKRQKLGRIMKTVVLVIGLFERGDDGK